MIEAHCHCGEIQLSVRTLPPAVTRCNCSICRRYGALWAYYSPLEVSTREQQPTSVYRWGEKDIEFHFCANCGCLTHYLSDNLPKGSRIAINARMMASDILEQIPVRHFDGADSWQFIDQ
jgi:hypothetical protein